MIVARVHSRPKPGNGPFGAELAWVRVDIAAMP
jgi:hypothetical protein